MAGERESWREEGGATEVDLVEIFSLVSSKKLRAEQRVSRYVGHRFVISGFDTAEYRTETVPMAVNIPDRLSTLQSPSSSS